MINKNNKQKYEAINFLSIFEIFLRTSLREKSETVLFRRIGYDVYTLTCWRDVPSVFCMELLSMLQHRIFRLCSSDLDR